MKARRRVGGFTPQQHNKINKFNNRSTLCKLCEFAGVDRKYSPKTELVVLTSSVLVMRGGNYGC